MDDVRNTGQTLARCAELVRSGGGTVIATARDLRPHGSDRELDVPNYPLAEYKAPENYASRFVPAVSRGVPITSF